MCIIIYKPAGVILPVSTIARAFRRNDDGFGLVARTDAGLVVRRGCGSDALEALLDAYDELRGEDLTIHCRIATSGEVDIRNTHPFEVTPNLWMFHNGTINIDRSADESLCDSAHVARALCDALGDDAQLALRNPEYLKNLEAYAGTSKLVFVDKDGVTLVNERLGFWADGCWFSNDSAEEDSREAQSRLYSYDLAEIEAFDEEISFADTLAFIDGLYDADVREIAEYCADYPDLAAEALFHLIHSKGVRTLALSSTA